MKLFVKLAIIFTIVSLFASRCANMAPPQGGPRDSLPPIVVRTTPAPYSTNFNSKKIVIEFDEYVQLKDQSKFFFVSPPGSKKPKIQIKKKSIEIQFENKLDSNTTYRLDFGNCIVDNNESNPLYGYSYVFSTGKAIDSLVMAGQTVGAYERDSVLGSYIFYFDAKVDDKTKDDSTMFNAKVDALFRTDSSGYFIADILKEKPYRIYALDDTNGDQKYQAGVDRIAFLDTIYNPVDLPPFSMIYDSTKRYMVIDPLQVKFELFKEIPVKRQSLSKQERPQRQKILFTFNSANPVIDSLNIQGIDPSWIIKEKGTVGDSLILWIAPPSKEEVAKLVDTIKGTLLLERQDSVWKPYNSKERLSLVHKIVLTQEQLKEKAKEERAKQQAIRQVERSKNGKKRKKSAVADTVTRNIAQDTVINAEKSKSKTDTTKAVKPINPFQFKTEAETPLNPNKHISFVFDYPLRKLDNARIELFHLVPETSLSKGKKNNIRERDRERAEEGVNVKTTEVPIPFTITNSPHDMRRWTLRADWKSDEEYKLMIPSGTFEDITFEANDTLNSKFKVANPDKYGSIEIKTIADTTDKNSYILEIVQKGSNKEFTIVDRVTGVKPGKTVTIQYLKPGTYNLRMIQDSNHNDKWDTGSLVHRLQPEKVRMLLAPDHTRRNMISKERWTVQEQIDFKKIFK